MVLTIDAIYEDSVFKPLSTVKGVKEHDHVKIIVQLSGVKNGLQQLVGTLSSQEAEEMRRLIEHEFEHRQQQQRIPL